jgi:hypothetical protein
LKEIGRGIILRYYPRIRQEGLRKATKKHGEDSQPPGRNLNPGTPEYEAGATVKMPKY